MMPTKKKPPAPAPPRVLRVEPPATFLYIAYCRQCGTPVNVHRKANFAVQITAQCLCPEGVSPLRNEALTKLYRRT